LCARRVAGGNCRADEGGLDKYSIIQYNIERYYMTLEAP